MKRTTGAALAGLGLSIIAVCALADEVTDNLNQAIEAYEAGEIQEAREIVEYAGLLLDRQCAGSFADILPDALPGWTKEAGDTEAASAAMGMLGGGDMAGATYYKNDGSQINLQIMADSPMMAMLAPQLANPAILAQMGEVRRINRQKVLLTNEGSLQAIVSNRFLVQIDGDASEADMTAYFGAIDLEALEGF